MLTSGNFLPNFDCYSYAEIGMDIFLESINFTVVLMKFPNATDWVNIDTTAQHQDLKGKVKIIKLSKFHIVI